MIKFPKISVIGLGYIGLPTAAMFASQKLEVVGVDVNKNAVETINRGEIHIIEPDLDGVVKTAVAEGYLRAVTQPEAADAFLIAVPTPLKGENHDPDLRFIEAASNAIAPVLKKGDLVILESTSPVGTTEQMAQWLSAARQDLTFPQDAGDASDIRVAHCPERVLPGKVMQELITNDRVIGGMTQKCAELSAELYRAFVTGKCVLASNPRVAEMAKLTENSFRDVNIAFANELSVICDGLDIDVWELVSLANLHPRVNILHPGPGVGGHCIAVDPWFIVSKSPGTAQLIRTAREVNDAKPEWVMDRIHAERELALKALKTDTCQLIFYGATFKPDIDDLRESPSLKIIEQMGERYTDPITVVEPNVSHLPSLGNRVKVVTDIAALPEGAVHVFLVNHKEFRTLRCPKGRIIDTCNVFPKISQQS